MAEDDEVFLVGYSICFHDSQIATSLPRIKIFGLWLGKEHATICTKCGEINVPFRSLT